MKISELIDSLQKAKDEYGDIDCWCNGEAGLKEVDLMETKDININSPCGLFYIETLDNIADIIDDSDIICHIGRI